MTRAPSSSPSKSPLDPPGFKWRDGKPMWIAAPRLRAAGWPSSIALRGAHGAYLRLGEARLMARRIVEDVARWRAGQPVISFGPHEELGEAAATARLRAAERTLAAAFERWRQHAAWRRIAPATRDNYRRDLKRFLDAFGDQRPEIVDRPTLIIWIETERDRVFALRALAWTQDRWRVASRTMGADGAAYVADVRAARQLAEDEGLTNTPGQGQVNATARAVSAFYTFIVDELGWLAEAAHPARRLRLPGLKPRLRLPSDAELAVMVNTADAMGLPGVADILITMAHAGQRPSDLFALPVSALDGGRIRLSPAKTRRRMGAGSGIDIRPSAILAGRLADVRARRAAALAGRPAPSASQPHPPQLFLTCATASPWTLTHFETQFAQVRARASGQTPSNDPDHPEPLPSCADLVAYDFRRKAITRLSEAGVTPQGIAAITGHSLKTISQILKHYSVATAELADTVMTRLDNHLAAKGVTW